MDGTIASDSGPRRLTPAATINAPADLSVDLYLMPAGTMQAPPSTSHVISMHAGAPVQAWCRCEGLSQRRMQTPGDIDIVPAGASGVWTDEQSATILLLRLAPGLLLATARDLDLNPDRMVLTPRLQLRDPRIEHLAWALKAEREDGYAGGRLYAESLGTALAAHLLRAHALPSASRPIGDRGLPARRLKRVLDFLEANLEQNPGLDELAAVAGFGLSHFKVLFRRSTGMPPHQYLLRRRVERACELLQQGRLSASQIALETGFAHQSHMARCMRRLLGVTPSALTRAAR
jgi:AraC family transcriptional regulator